MPTLVRDKKNQVCFFRPIQNRGIARLQCSIDEVIDYDQDTTHFVEVLKRFVAHRGTWLGETYDRKTTARDWVYRVKGMALLDDPYVADLHVLEISLVAKHMLDLHTQHHVPGAPDPKTTYNDLNQWVDVSRPYFRMLLGLSDEEHKRICTQIKDTAGGCRRCTVHCLTRWEIERGLSEWPITQIVEDGTHYRTNQRKLGGFF